LAAWGGSRGICARLALCAAAFGASLLLMELGFRAFWKGYYLTGVKAYITTSATRGWANSPSRVAEYGESEFRIEVTHNSLGFRGPEVAPNPPPNMRRVLVLGDSFAYGIGVADDETFSARLAALDPRLEVLNSGVNGYGTGQELLLLREYAATLHPDLVLVAFFWNDVGNSFHRSFPRFQLVDGSLVWPDPLPAAPPMQPSARHPWLRHSYLFRFASDRLKLGRWWLTVAFSIPTESSDFVAQSERDEAWQLMRALLAAVRDEARGVGARTAVLAIPDQVQVERARVIGLDPEDYEIQPRLGEICRELGIALIDPLPELRAAATSGGEPLYYPVDRHLKKAGHEIVARVLAREIEELALLPPRP
jgi:lysophospholipase L1-like esterase